MTRTLASIAMVLALGCGVEEQSAERTSAAERDGLTEVERVAFMEAHYETTMLAHDALIEGDLAAFREHLAATDSHVLPPDAPAHWKPFDAQLHEAARAGAEAADRRAAAEAMGRVALACGACHAGVEAGPVYPAPAARDSADPIEDAMLEHQWVSERLWEGVTGPWDNAWERGAAALAKTAVFGESASGPAPAEAQLRAEAALRALGAEAQRTETLPERAALYGRLLVTCSECHRALGIELPPYK